MRVCIYVCMSERRQIRRRAELWPPTIVRQQMPTISPHRRLLARVPTKEFQECDLRHSRARGSVTYPASLSHLQKRPAFSLSYSSEAHFLSAHFHWAHIHLVHFEVKMSWVICQWNYYFVFKFGHLHWFKREILIERERVTFVLYLGAKRMKRRIKTLKGYMEL